MAPVLKSDKREQILDILRDPKGIGNTNAAIARMVGCDEGSVRRIRSKLNGEGIHMMKGIIEQVPLDAIRSDPDTQPRVAMDDDLVNEYVQSWKDKADFPPVIAFREGDEFILGDGFHRTKAAKKAGRKTILADVREGGKRAAILYSAGANAGHGKRRNNEDIKRAVMILLNDREWFGWSDHQIARNCKVSHMTVGRWRPKSIWNTVPDDGDRKAIRNDEEYTIKTGGINADRGSKSNGQTSTSSDSAATPAEPDDSMSANPEDEGDPSSDPESVDEGDGEVSEPSHVRSTSKAERQGAGAAVEEVKADPSATEAKADPEGKFLATCPLIESLTRKDWKRTRKAPVEWFIQSARRYYRGRERKKNYFDFHKANLNGGKDAGNCLDPLASEDNWWLKISHPRDWHNCLGDETGQCHRDCRTCKGFGFLISREV